MKVLDNSMINVELMPGKSGQDVQDKAKGAAQDAGGQAQAKAQEAQGGAQSYADAAQQKASDLQGQAGGYQKQSADYIKNNADAAHQAGQGMVESSAQSAHDMAKKNLPESMHGYAGQAVDYGQNLASGTVGSVGGLAKDAGDTVGNAGYETVAGLGKTGYNLASGLGGAVSGGGQKAEEVAKEGAGEAEKQT